MADKIFEKISRLGPKFLIRGFWLNTNCQCTFNTIVAQFSSRGGCVPENFLFLVFFFVIFKNFVTIIIIIIIVVVVVVVVVININITYYQYYLLIRLGRTVIS